MTRGPIYRSPREKFLREVERETQAQAEHRVRIRFDGRYRAVCSCHWGTAPYESRATAEAMAEEHKREHRYGPTQGARNDALTTQDSQVSG